MIGDSAQQAHDGLPPSQMSGGEIQVSNSRYQPKGFCLQPLPNGNWAIFDHWWRYISRELVGCLEVDGLWRYEFYTGELSRVMQTLADGYEFRATDYHRQASAPKGQVVTEKSAEDLGL